MDCAGRVYQDYMLKMEGREHVRAFFDKLEQNRSLQLFEHFNDGKLQQQHHSAVERIDRTQRFAADTDSFGRINRKR